VLSVGVIGRAGELLEERLGVDALAGEGLGEGGRDARGRGRVAVVGGGFGAVAVGVEGGLELVEVDAGVLKGLVDGVADGLARVSGGVGVGLGLLDGLVDLLAEVGELGAGEALGREGGVEAAAGLLRLAFRIGGGRRRGAVGLPGSGVTVVVAELGGCDAATSGGRARGADGGHDVILSARAGRSGGVDRAAGVRARGGWPRWRWYRRGAARLISVRGEDDAARGGWATGGVGG
jgi:hypothetical protein